MDTIITRITNYLCDTITNVAAIYGERHLGTWFREREGERGRERGGERGERRGEREEERGRRGGRERESGEERKGAKKG